MVSLAFLVLAGSTLLATGQPCTVHPKKGAKKDELASMAKVSRDDAQKTALSSLKDPSKASVKEGELEAEHGCLVYSFDIAIEGQSGLQEVQVDAGNGKVLSSKHESAKAEADEKAKERAKPSGN
ncbi:MAG TPA: PepSY domain-containing protein [Thermoanaerobaculia bacterium]